MEKVNREKLELLTLENQYDIVLPDLNGLTAIEYLNQNPDLDYEDIPNYFWKAILHEPDGDVLYAPIPKHLKFPKLGDSVWELDSFFSFSQHERYRNYEINLKKETINNFDHRGFFFKQFHFFKTYASKCIKIGDILHDGLLPEFFMLFERRVPDYVTFDVGFGRSSINCDISSTDRKLFKFHNFKYSSTRYTKNYTYCSFFETPWFSNEIGTVSLITHRMEGHLIVNASHEIHGDVIVFGDHVKYKLVMYYDHNLIVSDDHIYW